jgi:glyoxylase-like metal-dependent hydrolase (beta-lactamase superfamily II)
MRIAPGIHRLGPGMVNSYLIVDGDDVTIVDAGLPGHWKLLRAELSAIGKDLGAVRALILTHGDVDHIGFAARLHREAGITPYVHEADAARARLEVKKPNSGWGPVKAGPLARFLWYSARNGGLRVPPATALRTFAEDQTLDVPGSPRVIGMPGHTPGSVAVHVPGFDAVMAGDALTTRHVLTGARGPAPAPFTLAPEQADESLDRIAAIDATWLLPGHGPAWDGGVSEAVRVARARLRDGDRAFRAVGGGLGHGGRVLRRHRGIRHGAVAHLVEREHLRADLPAPRVALAAIGVNGDLHESRTSVRDNDF